MYLNVLTKELFNVSPVTPYIAFYRTHFDRCFPSFSEQLRKDGALVDWLHSLSPSNSKYITLNDDVTLNTTFSQQL